MFCLPFLYFLPIFLLSPLFPFTIIYIPRMNVFLCVSVCLCVRETEVEIETEIDPESENE